MILRKNNDTKEFDIMYKSEEQQHSFNFPFQIGTNGDNPNNSIAMSHDNIRDKDLVILGTDGLFDNYSHIDIKNFINNYIKNNDTNSKDYLPLIIKSLGEEVYKKSLDSNHPSPFALNARKEGYYYKGGKSDDITIVIGECIINN